VSGYRPGGSQFARALIAAAPERVGVVTGAVGLGVTVTGIDGATGDLVHIGDDHADIAQVVATGEQTLTCMPLHATSSHPVGTPVRPALNPPLVPTGRGLRGRVIDGLGRPIDGEGPLLPDAYVPLEHATPNPMARTRIDTPLTLGVKAMDTLLTVGRGQRMGLFAGSGVGKSSLLSMIARGTDAELTVIALIGERGREVREFLEDDLGADGLARSIVVVATSDEPALMRVRAAFLATRVAEAARDAGQDAVLMMDSLTRVAMAQREIGLSAGEPPATRGYPPSTFSLLASLLERAGTDHTGSITGLYTVLVDGDDHNEPVADAARSILDGHVVLDRKLAINGHFPSIDVLASVSRLASKLNTAEQAAAARTFRQVLSARRGAQDLLDVGAYKPGANPTVDAGVAYEETMNDFLQQTMTQQTSAAEAWSELTAVSAVLAGVR
jgi:flagellum-specific ATP synthase